MEETNRLKNKVTDRDHVAGPTDAPVTLLEYGNFECIDCGLVYHELKKVRKLLSESLCFVFRHFPTVKTHPHSMRAAEASEAAAAQGKFWEMHDQLFTHQAALQDDDLRRYASHIGLDHEQFSRDMEQNTFRARVEEDYKRSLFDEHITGTPTLYLNEERYNGFTDSESLLAAIKQADTRGEIHLPEHPASLRALFARLRKS